MDLLHGNINSSLKKDHESIMSKLVNYLLAYRVLFIISLGLSIMSAFLIIRNTIPTYLVRTSVLVNEKQSPKNNPNSYLYGEEDEQRNSDKPNLAEEVAVMNSIPFISRTIESLNWNVQYYIKGNLRNDELYEKTPFEVITLDTSTYKRLYNKRFKVSFLNNREYIIEEIFLSEKANRANRITIGKILNLYNCPVMIRLNELFNHDVIGKEYQFQFVSPEDLVWEYKSKLNIRSSSSEGSIIDIYVETPVPQKGIDFLNEFTKQYINYKYEEKSKAVSQGLAFIDNQLYSIGKSLGSTENSLVSFKTSNTYTDASKMSDMSIDELSQLEKQRTELSFNEKYYTAALGALNKGQLDRLVSPSSVGINDASSETLIQKVNLLQLEKSKSSSAEGLRNPLVKEMNAQVEEQINSVKATLQGSFKTLLANNRQKLNQIEASIAQHQGKVRSLPGIERKFVDIKRQNDLNEQIYLFLSQKKVEAGILKAATTVEIKIIESAKLESNIPLKPKKRNNYAVALFIGIMAPFGYIFLKKSLDKRISGRDDISNMCSVPVIGSIYHNYDNKYVVITPASRTAIAESFRVLRSFLLSLDVKGNSKVILISSMENGSGKSFCAFNIAKSLALVKKRTILINLDMRLTSTIYKELERSFGISSFLDDIAAVKDIISPTDHSFLDYIAAGDWPVHATELLIDDKIDVLISYLKNHYDYIVIDTPPLGLIADPFLIARKTDLNIIVVRSSYTLKEKLLELEDLNRSGKLKDIGVLINDETVDRKILHNSYYNEDINAGKKFRLKMVKLFRTKVLHD